MRPTYITIGVLLTLAISSQAQQTITLKSIKPEEISAYNKKNSNDNGIRTIEITLVLKGKRKNPFDLDLEIEANNILSEPKLLEKTIHIQAMAFTKNGNTVKYPVKIQVKPLACLFEDESFKLGEKNKSATNLEIKIKHFTKRSTVPTITLDQDTTFVKPYIAGTSDNGFRAAVMNVTLSGPSPASSENIKFNIPDFHLSSNPGIPSSTVFNPIPNTAFPNNGCPVTLPIPIAIQLQPIPKEGAEERVPIILDKDLFHFHTLIIRSDQPKATTATTEKKAEEPKRIPGFSHACVTGRNFEITLKPDSIGNGGSVEVREGSEAPSVYYFKNYFHSADCAKWLLNIYGNRIRKAGCEECGCAGYLSERIHEELLALRKAAETSKPVTEPKTAADSKNTAAGGSATTTTTGALAITPTASTSSSTTTNTAPDLVEYTAYITYADTALYNLNIKRTKAKTEIRLCREPKKGADSCNAQTSAEELTKESFERYILMMLQKLRGDEIIEQQKIAPSLPERYSEYVKEIEKKNPKEKSDLEKLKDEFKVRLETDEFTETTVGLISIRDTMINVFDNRGEPIKKVKVDTVSFSIESGKLARKLLRIQTSDGVFKNHRAPIPVNRINERWEDHLYNERTNANTFIKLGDALAYKTIRGYLPDDVDSASLHRAKLSRFLNAASNLNSLINIAVFTDLAGLLGRKANGLINSDISGKFQTNTNNVWNRDISFWSFIEGNIVLAKFDSKFKSIDSTDFRKGLNGELDTVDRMQLIQTAWLKGSVKLNVIQIKFLMNQAIEVNLGARINVVNADSFYLKKPGPPRKETDILFFDYYPELLYSVNRLRNCSMELGLRWIFQRVADREDFANKGLHYIFNPTMGFAYHPKSDPNKKIYFRFNYFANSDKTAKNFYQLQLGWKTGLKAPSK